MKRPYAEYLAMSEGDRIAAYYAEIDELIASSANPEALRHTQAALDQIHFRGQNGGAYGKILAWLERSMLNQSFLLDGLEAKIGQARAASDVVTKGQA